MWFINLLLFLGLVLLISLILHGINILYYKDREDKEKQASFTVIILVVGGFLIMIFIILGRFIDIFNFWSNIF